MKTDDLASEFFALHFNYAKELYQIVDKLSAAGEEGVLYYLYKENQKVLSGTFVEKLGLTTGRVANILTSLEKKNYILRTRDTLDKRKIFVSLTESGKDYIINVYEECGRLYHQIAERMGIEDAREYLRLAEKVFLGIRELGPELGSGTVKKV